MTLYKQPKARKVDVLLCDTAGRLQNKVNLMKELEKVKRVIEREVPGAPHEVLLVIDATTGQNGLSQAKTFREATNVTGIVLTKLDGTAKGGIVLAIRNEMDVPVKFVGLESKWMTCAVRSRTICVWFICELSRNRRSISERSGISAFSIKIYDVKKKLDTLLDYM